MSISSVGSSTSYDATQIASSLVSSLDSSKDGSVDKSEFVKGMTAIGVSSDDASAEFDKLDSAKTGKLTQSSLEAALSSSSSSTTTSSTTTISSAAVEKLASELSSSSSSSSSTSSSSASATTTSSSSSKTYEKADANENGEVTTQEQLAYDRKQAEAAANSERGRPPMPPQFGGGRIDETA